MYHFCVGSIINEKYILTAAHCVNELTGKDFFVHVGLHDSKNIDNNNLYNIKSLFYLSYEYGTDGDLALIELKENIELVNGLTEPACLNFVDQHFPCGLLSAGWGNIEKTWQDLSLRDNNGFLVHPPKNVTFLKYYFSEQVFKNCPSYEICTMAKNKGDSICHGDSGGPLMYTRNGRTSIVGITSTGLSVIEGSKRIYCLGDGSFTRLSLYKDYISKFVGEYCQI